MPGHHMVGAAVALASLLAAADVVAPPSAVFSTPVIVGSSNSSTPDGSAFWFPAISIPTGLPNHVAQHITLSGDGGSCPRPGHPHQSCEQIMLTKDGGKTYEVVKKMNSGTSGNFDGYGDLGAWVPAQKGKQPQKGEFSTIVGCNDCPGGTLQKANFLQTWLDDGTTLKLVKNVSATYKGVPSGFDENKKCGTDHVRQCGLGPPDQNIIRTPDGNLMSAHYGYAADGYKNGSLYTTAYFTSADEGLTWTFASRIDVTPAMMPPPGHGEGPCEPGLATLADGRVLTALRLSGGIPLWLAWSKDNGKSWTAPRAATGSLGVWKHVYGVWPQLLRLSNGALVLASGRPGIGFWISPKADGQDWVGYDVEAEHNKRMPAADQYGPDSGTTSYTGIAEVEPGVVLLAYDKQGAHRTGAVQKVYSVRITVTP